MRLSVLNVAYPFARVGPETAGGAEQVLLALDAALVDGGHRSYVVARSGSSVKGTLIEVPVPDGLIDAGARAFVHEALRKAIARAIEEHPVDMVHLHGVDFDSYLPDAGLPVLVTLHLPLSWYREGALAPQRPQTYLHCVSASQGASGGKGFLPVIENGVDTDFFNIGVRKKGYALSIGRICPEKGFHMAMDAAKKAGVPFVLAGEVARYAWHESYFREEITPRLGGDCFYIGAVAPERKRRLLAGAGCVLIPSLVPETSSLVAMEALASGTPVVAFGSGALKEIVDYGVTGFLVDDCESMSAAIGKARKIKPEACRDAARKRFGSGRMIKGYLDAYGLLSGKKAHA